MAGIYRGISGDRVILSCVQFSAIVESEDMEDSYSATSPPDSTNADPSSVMGVLR